MPKQDQPVVSDELQQKVQAASHAAQALNDALTHLALEMVHARVEVGETRAVSGFPRQYVRVSAWLETMLL